LYLEVITAPEENGEDVPKEKWDSGYPGRGEPVVLKLGNRDIRPFRSFEDSRYSPFKVKIGTEWIISFREEVAEGCGKRIPCQQELQSRYRWLFPEGNLLALIL
jgi:hypothetical protein